MRSLRNWGGSEKFGVASRLSCLGPQLIALIGTSGDLSLFIAGKSLFSATKVVRVGVELSVQTINHMPPHSLAPGHALVIAPSQGVHTFGMRFPIDIVAIDRQGRVVKIRPNVRPNRIVFAWSAFAMLELNAGSVDSSLLLVGDCLLTDG